nr:hypothetical protein [Tanacetum cinerariifolium]
MPKDHFPKSFEFNAEHFATLVALPAPFHKYPEPFLCLVGISHAEAKGEPIPTLPFVTSSVSATPEREDKSPTDSVPGLNLRTIGASQRFVISSDSSHHSGANIAEAEVGSIVRSSAPAIATVTTVTVAIDADATATRAPVAPSLFGVGSSSTGRIDSVPGGFSDVSGSDFLIGGIRTVVDLVSDLQKVYVPRWSATNRFGLDDSRICREIRYYTLDEDAYPEFLGDNDEGRNGFACFHLKCESYESKGCRERAENEPRLLESTIGRVVSLLSIAPACASSELEASVDKLFDKGASGDGQDADVQPVDVTTDTIVEDVAPLQPRSQRKRKTVVADAGGPSHPFKKLREDCGALGGASTAGKSMSAVIFSQLLRGMRRATSIGNSSFPLPLAPWLQRSHILHNGVGGHSNGLNISILSIPTSPLIKKFVNSNFQLAGSTSRSNREERLNTPKSRLQKPMFIFHALPLRNPYFGRIRSPNKSKQIHSCTKTRRKQELSKYSQQRQETRKSSQQTPTLIIITKKLSISILVKGIITANSH